jgi:glycosyltransferase involved in cell wall biosynthesis
MKIVHIISGLDVGGAEMMLFKLLSAWNGPADLIEVVSLTNKGPIAARIEALGISVIALNMPRGRPSLRGLIKLSFLLRKSSPDIVHCWMYHGNLIGGLAALMSRRKAVLWGIRTSTLSSKGNRRSTILTAKAGAWTSGILSQKIVCCSRVALDVHATLGYCREKMMVIPNGFDLTRFKPDAMARNSVREELEVPLDAVLIGLIARFDPQKDHQNFVDAAAIVARSYPDIHFVLCGQGVDRQNPALAGWIAGSGASNRFHLLGRRDDVPRLTASLDIGASSSSYGEAFPNVLGEAMASGVPCVSTNVGDSAEIIGATGLIVAPRSPQLLAAAFARLIEAGSIGRSKLGAEARARVDERYELGAIVRRYKGVYEDMLNDNPSRSSDY